MDKRLRLGDGGDTGLQSQYVLRSTGIYVNLISYQLSSANDLDLRLGFPGRD
jgi:hypothetical protein